MEGIMINICENDMLRNKKFRIENGYLSRGTYPICNTYEVPPPPPSPGSEPSVKRANDDIKWEWEREDPLLLGDLHLELLPGLLLLLRCISLIQLLPPGLQVLPQHGVLLLQRLTTLLQLRHDVLQSTHHAVHLSNKAVTSYYQGWDGKDLKVYII